MFCCWQFYNVYPSLSVCPSTSSLDPRSEPSVVGRNVGR